MVRRMAVPADHRYFASATETGGRIWLVDLAIGTTIEVVTTSEAQPTGPAFSESRDGRRLLVSGRGPNGRAALYVVDIESGMTTLLYEDRITVCGGCLGGKLSADGSWYAFSDADGVLVGSTAGGSPTLVASHVSRNEGDGTWQPMAWAPDGESLALWRGWESGSEIGIVRLSTRALTIVGPGHALAWREKRPQLVITRGVTAFGGMSEIYTYDLVTAAKHDLEPIGRSNLWSPAWDPNEDRFVFIQGNTLGPQNGVFTRELGKSSATKIGTAVEFIEAWWSHDGTRVYAAVARMDLLAGAPGVANLEIVEYPGARAVASVCRQYSASSCS